MAYECSCLRCTLSRMLDAVVVEQLNRSIQQSNKLGQQEGKDAFREFIRRRRL